MEHSEEAVGEFVVSSGDGAVDFEMTDHALDVFAPAIEVLVASDCRLAVGSQRDDRPRIPRAHSPCPLGPGLITSR